MIKRLTTSTEPLICSNCGEKGHLNKQCKKPVQSYGIILYKDEPEIRYLMICNKDSYGYIQFLRGRYSKYDLPYIRNLFTEMTKTELTNLLVLDFNQLWSKLWMEEHFKLQHNYHIRDKEFAFMKFNMLKEGYDIFGKIISIRSLVNEVLSTAWDEPEWGFPKGRRNNKETPKECALREFIEETALASEDIEFNDRIPIINEVFKGSDNVLYEHTYFIAKYIGSETPYLDMTNKNQATEISKVEFLSYDDAIISIRDTMPWRKELLNKINTNLINHFNSTELDSGEPTDLEEETINSKEIIDLN
jgi:8-oxo-dGTP pyrophosphatase MutT (NUDIX family)